MRNHQWRLLLFHLRHHSPITHNPTTHLLSLHHIPHTPFLSSFRHFSSNPIDQTLSNSSTHQQIQTQLDSNTITLTDSSLLDLMVKDPESENEIVRRVSKWVVERGGDGVGLSSKSYNLMLGILGSNGFVKEFWELVGIVKKLGFGLSKGTFRVVEERFERDGLESDLGRLRRFYELKELENGMVGSVEDEVCRIVRGKVWDEEVEKRIMGLDVSFTSDLVATVLGNLKRVPSKALIFFRWVDESGLFKHDQKTYNAMGTVLGRGDYADRFWNVVREMRDAGFEIEMGTYMEALNDFVGMRMMKDSVDLYEFAINGANKPPKSDCTFLLKKIAAAKELNMELFSKVVKVFTDSGNELDDAHMNAVLKSLMSVGRIGDSSKILEVMVGAGLKPSSALQKKLVFQLSSLGNKDGATKLMENLQVYGFKPDCKTWTSLVQGHCVAGNLEEASLCLERMADAVGEASAGYAFEVLVTAYCSKNKAVEACRLLCDMITAKGLQPSHPTYKTLIKKLLAQNGFEYAVELLPLMKNHGFPPYVDPFIKHVSKQGTADDAMTLLKAMTIQKYPSTTVFLRMFQVFTEAGRFAEAQDLLVKCPRYIRENPAVLDLFASMVSKEDASPASAVAS